MRLIGGEARVALVGLVPLRLVDRPAAGGVRVRLLRGRRPGVGGAGDHPRPLQGHVVVRRLPGRMGRPFGEVGDGDSDVAWRGGRRLSIPALLPCYDEDKVPAIKNAVDDDFLPPMSMKTYRVIIYTAE